MRMISKGYRRIVPPERLSIGGHWYYRHKTCDTKSEATSVARKNRACGYYASVQRVPYRKPGEPTINRVYVVYVRKKAKR